MTAAASNRCEYCRLPAFAHYRTLHVDHVRPKQHGGRDEFGNLALSCPRCNAIKGPNFNSFDPVTDAVTPLLHPRTDAWQAHFAAVGPEIIGTTDVGRTTAELLKLNDAEPLELRRFIGADWPGLT